MIPLRDNLRIKDFPLLTVLLVLINVGVFFGWQGGNDTDVEKILLYGTVPYEVSHTGTQCMPSQTTVNVFECDPEEVQEKRWNTEFPATWKTFFTSMFMHISLGHLIGNMIFLIVFGLALEAGLGRASFLLFYIVGGLAADVGHILFDPGSQVPALGASGAISAVMGGYLMLYPRAKIFTWIIPPLPFLWGWIRANWLIGINLGLQALTAYLTMEAAYGSGAGGGVAYFAHFGGFLAGLALVRIAVDDDTVQSLRRMARLASGDEQRIVEHIETPPGQPAPQSSYPYDAPQPPASPGQAIFGQSTHYAGPTAVPAAAPDPFAPAPGAAPGLAPDPFAPPPDPFAPPPAAAPGSPPDPFVPRQSPHPAQAPDGEQAPPGHAAGPPAA